MHDQLWDDLHERLDRLSDAEKRRLIGEVSRSLDRSARPADQKLMTPPQRQRYLEILDEIERMPAELEPDDGLIASRDHDVILYSDNSTQDSTENPAP